MRFQNLRPLATAVLLAGAIAFALRCAMTVPEKEMPVPVAPTETPTAESVTTKFVAAPEASPRTAYLLGERMRGCLPIVELYDLTGMEEESLRECRVFLAGAPLPHEWRYWHDAALRAGDPVAVLAEAYEQYETKHAPREELEYAMRVAEESGDPEALTLLAQVRGVVEN